MPHKRTKFGHGTFWPSNKMHDAIPFPEIPKKPVMPVDPKSLDPKLNDRYKADMLEYKEALKKYREEQINYNTSIAIKPSPTFHHLYVMYNKANIINMHRFNSYIEADIPKETKLRKELYKLEIESKKTIKNEKK